MVVTVFVVAAMAALYRRLGPRTLLFVALACNALGSMGGLVAPTFAVLFASRLVQAVGTGIFIPLMMNAILETVASEKLGTYLAVGNGMIALGPRRGALWPPVPSSAPLAGIACSWFPWWFRRL